MRRSGGDIALTVAMIFLCLTAGGVLCCALFEKQLEETLAVGPLAIVFVLYWGGLLGALKESVYLVLAICALCYALALCTAWQRRRLRPLLKNIFTPGFWVWLLSVSYTHLTLPTTERV